MMSRDGVGLMVEPKRERPPLPDKTVAFRVSGVYAKWLDELARHNRTSISALLDQALTDYAKSIGFDKEAPDR